MGLRFKWMILACTWWLFAWPSCSAQAQAAQPAPLAEALTIFVSPQGDDRWSGHSERLDAPGGTGPLRTWRAAQQLSRSQLALIARGQQARRPLHVLLLPGDYSLDQPMRFLPQDSGQPGAPVVYAARVPGTVHISGGIKLKPMAQQGLGLSFAPPATGWNPMDAGQLFVNGRRAILARQPNVGAEWFVQQGLTQPGETGNTIGTNTFQPPADAGRWLSSLSRDDRTRATVHLYQSWTSGRHHLHPESTPERWHLQPAPLWKFLNFGTSQRFYVENVAAALDAPGEWIGEPSTIRYIARTEDAGQLPVATLAVLDRLIVIEHEEGSAEQVHDLEFRGLQFEYTKLSIPATGLTDTFAAINVLAAIEVNNAIRITIEDCTVTHIGGYGIWLRTNVRDSRINRTTLTDLGAGGIKVGDPKQTTSAAPATGSNVIQNSIIQNTGNLLPGTIGILIGPSWDNVVSHNLISHTTYSGITVGWRLGYGDPTSGRNLISGNLLYNIGMGALSDMGGIYTLGISPGTRITDNVIREVRGNTNYGPGNGRGAWGIYNDEGSSQIIIEHNVVIGTDSGGYHLNYGRHNLIRKNLFGHSDQADIRVSGGDPKEISATFEDNLITSTAETPFEGYFNEKNVIFSRNLFNLTKKSGNSKPIARCQDGCSPSNIQIIVDSHPHNISLSGLAPEVIADWRTVVSNAGPAGLQAQALGQIDMTKPATISAGPLPFTLDITNTPIGSQPPGMSYTPKSDTHAITMAARPDDPSGKCLKFIDSANFSARYEPFSSVRLNHTSGVSSVEFSLWIDEHTEFINEWRDGAWPFQTGPSLRVTAAGITAGVKPIGKIPVRGWNSFKIQAPLGTAAGQWELDITDTIGKTSHYSDLKNMSATWHELQWLGFISEATTSSEFCLDRLKVSHSSQ
jgi:hypothetical protein